MELEPMEDDDTLISISMIKMQQIYAHVHLSRLLSGTTALGRSLGWTTPITVAGPEPGLGPESTKACHRRSQGHVLS